eukprot:GHVT01082633.1.p1 GENE.GHVT01082633.1~~GHVT01082633.1.p1  ORF type:complete len:496 (+),score=85.04 GHVT01082633.1:1063-2550(+)
MVGPGADPNNLPAAAHEEEAHSDDGRPRSSPQQASETFQAGRQIVETFTTGQAGGTAGGSANLPEQAAAAPPSTNSIDSFPSLSCLAFPLLGNRGAAAASLRTAIAAIPAYTVTQIKLDSYATNTWPPTAPPAAAFAQPTHRDSSVCTPQGESESRDGRTHSERQHLLGLRHAYSHHCASMGITCCTSFSSLAPSASASSNEDTAVGLQVQSLDRGCSSSLRRRMGDKGAAALVLPLALWGPAVVSIDLPSSDLGNSAAFSLSALMCHCPNLQSLCLKNNCIGPAGCLALCSALRPFDSSSVSRAGLRVLDLSGNPLEKLGGLAVVDALLGGLRPTESPMNSGSDGGTTAATFAPANHTASSAPIGKNAPKNADKLPSLSPPLGPPHRHLTTLDLSCTRASIDVLTVACEAALHAPILEKLLLDDASIFSLEAEHALHISRLISGTRSLRLLSLRKLRLGDSGAEAIAEALKANRTLEELYMSSNQITFASHKPI